MSEHSRSDSEATHTPVGATDPQPLVESDQDRHPERAEDGGRQAADQARATRTTER
jgi:hypothetical protein